jgi:hypothetical protein
VSGPNIKLWYHQRGKIERKEGRKEGRTEGSKEGRKEGRKGRKSNLLLGRGSSSRDPAIARP